MRNILINRKILISLLFILAITLSASFAQEDDISAKADGISDKPQAVIVDELQKTTLNPKEEKVLPVSPREKIIPGKHEAESYYTYLPSSKSKSGNGSIGLIESGFDYSYEFKLFNQLPITLSLGSEYIGIDDSQAFDLPSHLTGLTAGLDVILPFFNIDKTYISTGLQPSFYSDNWSFNTSAFRMPVNSFLIYTPSEKLTIIGGVAVFPDFKEKIFPIFGFVYKPNEKIVFNITSENPSIAYSPNEKITFFGEIRTPLGGEFEVTRQNRGGVVLMYNDTRLGAGAEYNFNKSVSASVSLGGVFGRYFKYRDEDGKVSMKNGLYSKFSVDVIM